MLFRKSISETKTNTPPYLKHRFEQAEQAMEIRDKQKESQTIQCRLPFSPGLEIIIYEPLEE